VTASPRVFELAAQLARALDSDFVGQVRLNVHRGGVRRIEVLQALKSVEAK